jgi:hypothetical protein
MKKKKLNNFNIAQVIEANTSLPSVKRALSSVFKFSDISLLRNPKYIQYYKTWEESKRLDFIKLIGGPANLKKTKAFLDKIFEKKYECK